MKWFEQLYKKEFINIVGFKSDEETQIEANFIIDKLGLVPGSKVLDLCCGYGRHSYLIAKNADFEVTGIDLSEDYIKIANREKSTPKTKYLIGDMRDLPFKNHFDAVINMFTSFGFFENDLENEQVIKKVNKSLKIKGKFLLDYENKFNFVHNDVFLNEKSWNKIDNQNFILFENRYDIINEREIFSAQFYRNGVLINKIGYNIRLYSFPEIKKILNQNGFEIIDFWGDYQSNPYSVKSKRVIILSEKIKNIVN